MTAAVRIYRWTTAAPLGAWGTLAVLVLLALALLGPSAGLTGRLTALFIYVILAAMWNALAGYGGVVFIGQQMFFGLGAYVTIRIADQGVDPFVALALRRHFLAGPRQRRWNDANC